MRSKLKRACLLGCAGLAGVARASAAADTVPADANPYSVISVRNVFHLTDPPPPPPPPEPKALDLPKVMLTGFVGKGASMKVLIAIPPATAKESIYYTSLVPGQKDHDVELVKIHLDKEEVEIINRGTPQTLSVKSNSYSSVAAAAPAGKGGPPGMPNGIGLRHPPPGMVQPNAPQAHPSAPAADNTPSGGSAIVAGGGGGGSAIIAGGGSSGGTAAPYGGFGASTSGAIVSGGGGSSYAANGAPAAGNNVGNQIANSLFNGQNGRYQMPAPNAPPAPREVQQAALLLRQAAGGPPVPPSVQQAAADAEAGEGGVPPGPPLPQ